MERKRPAVTALGGRRCAAKNAKERAAGSPIVAGCGLKKLPAKDTRLRRCWTRSLKSCRRETAFRVWLKERFVGFNRLCSRVIDHLN